MVMLSLISKGKFLQFSKFNSLIFICNFSSMTFCSLVIAQKQNKYCRDFLFAHFYHGYSKKMHIFTLCERTSW